MTDEAKHTLNQMASGQTPAGEPLPEDFDWSQISKRDLLYLIELMKDFNAARAAREVGFADTTADKKAAGWVGKSRETSTKPLLYDAFQVLLAARASQSWSDANRVLEEISYIAFSRVGDFVEVKENRVVIKNLENIPPEAQAAIKKISTNQGKFGTGHTLELHDKLAALVRLGQHHGLWSDKLEVSGPGGGPIQFALPQALVDKIGEHYAG